jgi:5-methyltetrahydrofolate--homocysteine methyltransferase
MAASVSGGVTGEGTSPLATAVATGEVYDIAELLQQGLDAGQVPMACLEAMMAGLETAGHRFENGEYFVPELMMAADTFKEAMDVLAPHLAEGSRAYAGTVILGTVEGDVHDIGKNLVGFLLESSGFRLIDLGVDVPPQRFVQAAQEHAADVVAMSALLTTTMLGMSKVVAALEEAGLRERVKIIIGGAPVSSRFAGQIGADAYASSAPEGVDTVKAWLTG